MVILSFCLIELYFLSNLRGMAVNYTSERFITSAPDKTIPNTVVIYCYILTLQKEGTSAYKIDRRIL